MIPITLVNGQKAAIKPGEFVRLRPPSLPGEAGATAVLFTPEVHLVLDQVAPLAEAFGRFIKVARFTTVNDLPIFVATERIGRILPANTSEHHPNARSTLDLPGGALQVRETVDEAARLVSNAQIGSADPARDRPATSENEPLGPKPERLTFTRRKRTAARTGKSSRR